MNSIIINLIGLFLIIQSANADICQATTKSYTANDGLVLISTGHVIQFTTNNCPKDAIPAYAVLNNGQTLTVAHVDSAGLYQISWTNELSKSSSGSYDILVFDENGYQQYRKTQRSGSSAAADTSRALFTIPFRHQSPYSGPFVRTEFAALMITLFISYYAIALRFKIMEKKI